MTDTWTIFGDPSVIVRSDAPAPMVVSHSTLEVVGVNQLAINCNKNGAIVCLTKQGNILGTGIVASGSVNISFPAINSIDSIDVTVTAYNCIPYFGKTYVQCPANLMTLNTNNTSICAGKSATLTASGASSYTWNTSSNAASIVVNPTSSTQYTVTGTLNNVCFESKVINVTVNQLPNVTFNQNPTSVCLGSGLVPFNGLPAGGSYSGNGVSGNNFNVGTAGSGSHQIVYTYTDANNCVNTATATMLVDPCAGLNENVLEQNISIYPVPATDHVVIKFTAANDNMQISIYNAIGQVVSQKTITKGSSSLKLETSEYARGVYFLKVKTGEQTKFVKFVLE